MGENGSGRGGVYRGLGFFFVSTVGGLAKKRENWDNFPLCLHLDELVLLSIQ
jgi:hypothetical protein